jgi:hypothetical protein
MTGIRILLGVNVILWKILIKLMFAKKLPGQKKIRLVGQGRAAGQPCPVTVSVS